MKKSMMRGVPSLIVLVLGCMASCVPVVETWDGDDPDNDEHVRVDPEDEEPAEGSQCIPEPVAPLCELRTDEELWADTKYPQKLGTCYWHDNIQCPSCACPYYLKDLSVPDPSGFDGGTGCLGSKEEVLENLRALCASGGCDCG